MLVDPVASIVVPSFRGADRLPQLLDSLAAQDAAPSFEVIVVVDGVDDGSVALLENESRLDARSIVFPENRGRVAALNAGFEAARGDVLIRCDDDLVPRPDYVSAHVNSHRDGPGGVIGLYLNEYSTTPYAEVYGKDADERFRRDAYGSAPSMAWRYWAGNCSITRAIWDSVGPYDPEYRLYGWEDVDYGYRIHKAGFEVRLAPELETPHRVAAVTTAIRARRASHSGAARRLFERKHPQAGLPDAIPGWSLWNALVRGLSRIPLKPARLGSVVDALLRFLPRGVGRKIVALSVESAALGGYRSPHSAKERF
ncbi:glycosyltransferase family 2 protein [Brachybacterium conglomeratum]|uniref:glycosyltransferase family 2 protein n=1 Tax=Brachybacterium conglomeratum TaxID=47846 RepID=UPI003D9FBE1B